MKNKQKLINSGWLYICMWRGDYEVYRRGKLRLIYDPRSDEAMAYYDDSKRVNGSVFLKIITEAIFKILTEK